MYIASSKIPESEGASYHSAFMGSHPTISHTFLPLPSKWMSFSSRKWTCKVSPRLHLNAFVFGVNQENLEAGGVQDSLV